MNNTLFQLSELSFSFPDPRLALNDPDGLLAIGGDLAPERLVNAYQNGIFPWFNEDDPLMWWSPKERAIIELDEFHISRSMKKFQRKHKFTVTVNQAFSDVMFACQQQRIDTQGTWITNEMEEAYNRLHELGVAHSVEIWFEQQLVGGLYGVMQRHVFCGESMFHTMANTSKLASWALVNWLKRHNGAFIDCQIMNPYLESLGAKAISRSAFLNKLHQPWPKVDLAAMWQPQTLDDIYD